LLATLQRAKAAKRKDLSGIVLFYFTDNMTTNCVVENRCSHNPRLHELVQTIKLLEVELQCQVEVVHVPGTSMIGQGTDGSSRGVWCNTLFAPVPYDSAMGTWVIEAATLPSSTKWSYLHWLNGQNPNLVMDCLTVWCPPPEIAYQIIYFMLQCWMELLLTTGAIFLIPRILQKCWSCMSRHVKEIGMCNAELVPLTPPPLAPIPPVLLYLAPHQGTLPPPTRVDPPATAPNEARHRKQAGLLRGLPSADLAEFNKD
jgi:hypothetical protein